MQLRERCMSCREDNDILLSKCTRPGVSGCCDHKICKSCFRKENSYIASTSIHPFTCPCCHAVYFYDMQSVDEAVLIGEATNLTSCIDLHMTRDVIPAEEVLNIFEIIDKAIEMFEAAIVLNPTNVYTLYLLFLISCRALRFSINHGHLILYSNVPPIDEWCAIMYANILRVLDLPAASDEGNEAIKSDCCDQLARVYNANRNYFAALKYSKLAYEICLRSSDHTHLSKYKDLYLEYRDVFAEQPPLRFAVGDEVEFLHELGTGSKWKRGKVVELYYWERDFDMNFTAPYRLQLLDEKGDQPPVYAWVKVDVDRYVRKLGVRSIEDTRYQARLDAKVAELARVYCSMEFIHDIYHTLVQDLEFVETLRSVWGIELSVGILIIYRAAVVNREPLVRTDSGYHVPTTEEFLFGIKAYFDPVHLSSDDDARPSAVEGRFSMEIRADILCMLRNNVSPTRSLDANNIQGNLLSSIRNYISLLSRPSASGAEDDMLGPDTIPIELSEGLSRATTVHGLWNLNTNAILDTDAGQFILTWIGILTCLVDPTAGPACECLFVYFFIKDCLTHSLGVPKPALALYDRMNMQLSREFIRCANPTCELNRLDKSTGNIKFKKCSRCQAVIYCSRECQTAHYPDHKRLCRVHSTG